MASNARANIVAALEAPGVLPTGWRVMPYARNIDPPAVVTVMVRLDKVAPIPNHPEGFRVYTAGLVIVAPLTDPTGPADDQVDDALDLVLAALDAHPNLAWTEAVRGTYAPKDSALFPTYEVTTESRISVRSQPA